MDTQIESPKDWIRQIPGDLFSLDETPLLGYPPSFPWEDFTKKLTEALQVDKINIQAAEWQWRAKDELFAGLGDSFKCTPITLTPITGTAYWVLPEKEVSQLMGYLLAKQQARDNEAIDPDFREAFYRFLTVEVLGIFEKIDFDKKLSPSMMHSETLPSSHCLARDLNISVGQKLTLHGRLLLSPEFRKSWTQHYQPTTNAILSSPLVDKINLIVQLEAGKVSLTRSEWKSVRVGDFIQLDTCSLEPDEDKGRVMLVINGIPFFRGRIKQGSIKILEHPLYHEAGVAMTNPPENKKEENDESILEESELDSEFDSEIESEIENDTKGTENSEISEEDFEIEEEEPTKAEKTAPPQAKAPAATSEKAPPSIIKEQLAPGTPASIEEIPLTIVIEAGRIQMSVKKLMELQPGNMLDLNIHPEAGVDLVINGRRIAKGELLRIGEAMGVRIIELS